MHRYSSKPQFSHVHDKTNKELLPRDEMFYRFPYGDCRKLIDNPIALKNVAITRYPLLCYLDKLGNELAYFMSIMFTTRYFLLAVFH